VYKNKFWGYAMAFTRDIKDYCLPFESNIAHDAWIGWLAELKFKVIYIDQPLVLWRRQAYSKDYSVQNSNTRSHLSLFTQVQYRIVWAYRVLKRYLTKELCKTI
jgi:hypothetical protein